MQGKAIQEILLAFSLCYKLTWRLDHWLTTVISYFIFSTHEGAEQPGVYQTQQRAWNHAGLFWPPAGLLSAQAKSSAPYVIIWCLNAAVMDALRATISPLIQFLAFLELDQARPAKNDLLEGAPTGCRARAQLQPPPGIRSQDRPGAITEGVQGTVTRTQVRGDAELLGGVSLDPDQIGLVTSTSQIHRSYNLATTSSTPALHLGQD